MIKEDDFPKVTTIDFVESNEPKNYIIAKVRVEGEYFVSIWCDRVTVFATKPPLYCLFKGGDPSICGISAVKITVSEEIRRRLGISEEFLKMLNNTRASRRELERVGLKTRR